jgi:hypothetical protein
MTVANPPADDTTIQPTNNDRAVAAGDTPADTTTKIMRQPVRRWMVEGCATKSTKHIRAPSPPPYDQAMEALARPAATSTTINPAPIPPTDDGAVVVGATPTDTLKKLMRWPVWRRMMEAWMRPKVQTIFEQPVRHLMMKPCRR